MLNPTVRVAVEKALLTAKAERMCLEEYLVGKMATIKDCEARIISFQKQIGRVTGVPSPSNDCVGKARIIAFQKEIDELEDFLDAA